jgi:ABC-type oligopeptide transport system ATPase subunit
VEQGSPREAARNPQHPATKALPSMVPKRDPREASRPQLRTGETPDPVLRIAADGSGHAAACHLA